MNQQANRGFTLIELTLSMTFVSTLLLSIALLTMQISSIYNRGITMRDVNQAGQVISSDLQRTLNQSAQSEVKSIIRDTGGRLCVGNTVYAWNYAKDLNNNNPKFNVFADGHDGKIRLVKFESGSKSYCEQKGDNTYESIPNDVSDLLTNGGRELSIQSFTMSNPVLIDGGQALYNIRIKLGTNESIIKDTGCKEPDSSVDSEYCAVNEFNIMARSGNIDQ